MVTAMKFPTLPILLALAFALAGCTGHVLSPSGAGVLRAHSLSDVRGCRRLGPIEAELASLFATVGGKTPAEAPSLYNDLLTDARNKAGAMGGNRVLATSEPVANRQEFDVYLCED